MYETVGNAIEMDDRTLAHLRLVVMNKLRRSYMLDVPEREGHRTFWIHPSIPLQFHFFGNGSRVSIGRGWTR